MTNKLGSILVRDEDGNLKADFGLQKRMHRQQLLKNQDGRVMTEGEKQRLVEEMKTNAK